MGLHRESVVARYLALESARQSEFGELAKLRRRLEARRLQHFDDAIVFLEEPSKLVGETFHQIAENHLTNGEASVGQDVFEAEFIAAKLCLYYANDRGERCGGNFAQTFSLAALR